MRPSKSRSRSKNNRNRPAGGNIVNRVFDSSGPEGKVRGTPQQIIDKYNQLTRDAQLSGDRVAAENFAQHAEHYTRLLGEAQREMDTRREQAEQQARERQQAQEVQEAQRTTEEEAAPSEAAPPAAAAEDAAPQEKPRRQRARARRSEEPSEDVIDTGTSDSGLVETPENAPKPRRQRRKPSSDDQPEIHDAAE